MNTLFCGQKANTLFCGQKANTLFCALSLALVRSGKMSAEGGAVAKARAGPGTAGEGLARAGERAAMIASSLAQFDDRSFQQFVFGGPDAIRPMPDAGAERGGGPEAGAVPDAGAAQEGPAAHDGPAAAQGAVRLALEKLRIDVCSAVDSLQQTRKQIEQKLAEMPGRFTWKSWTPGFEELVNDVETLQTAFDKLLQEHAREKAACEKECSTLDARNRSNVFHFSEELQKERRLHRTTRDQCVRLRSEHAKVCRKMRQELQASSDSVKRLRAEEISNFDAQQLADLRDELNAAIGKVNMQTAKLAEDLVASTPSLHDCLCPIGLQLMRDPVIAADGHTYERAQIEQWIRVRGDGAVSPKTGFPLAHSNLVPNHTVKSLINSAVEAKLSEMRETHDHKKRKRGSTV